MATLADYFGAQECSTDPVMEDEMNFESNSLFSPSTYAAFAQPLNQASTLPPQIYTSPEWYEREIDSIFLKSWLVATREEEIPNPGDYVRVDFVNEPIIVVRDHDNNVRAMSASCRHRGAEIVKGKGNCRAFVCPYHGWAYRLDGQLLSAPAMGDAIAFDGKQCRLPAVRAETWGGFVFVNFDEDAPSLLSCLDDLPDRFKHHRFEEMRVTKKWVNRLNCNWKVWVENSREGYHVAMAHRGTVQRFYPDSKIDKFSARGKSGIYEINTSTNENGLYIPRNPVLPLIEGLPKEDLESTHFAIVYPHLLLNVPPDRITFHQYFPEGPEWTTLVTWCCFPESTIMRDDFEKVVPDYYAPMDLFIAEDKEICEVVQRGVRSRLARPGRFCPAEERTVHEFGRYLLNRVLGLPLT
jgi:phenylpropionate dioxygenase-like ring-hydroxylating dioxygenase large terminal subunit